MVSHQFSMSSQFVEIKALWGASHQEADQQLKNEGCEWRPIRNAGGLVYIASCEHNPEDDKAPSCALFRARDPQLLPCPMRRTC